MLRAQLRKSCAHATDLLGPSVGAVRAWLGGQWHPGGGARDRAGGPDLYYTGFALAIAAAVNAEVDAAGQRAWLAGWGDGEGLDLPHLASLLRCWGHLGGMPANRRDACARRLAGMPVTGPYEAFLALAAAEDLGMADAAPRSAAALPATWPGVTTNLAAAIIVQLEAGLPTPAAAVARLLAAADAMGGFRAAPEAPIPDLLSTATALHGLRRLDRLPPALIEPTLDFLDSLWLEAGAFRGSWDDPEGDVEWTWYGLLALGDLALAGAQSSD